MTGAEFEIFYDFFPLLHKKQSNLYEFRG